MNQEIRFRVYGIPQTKGSAKSFMRPGMRFPVVTNDNVKNKSWAQSVALVAQQHRIPGCPFEGPIGLTLDFVVPAPKSLPKTRPSFAIKRPDLDKMVRSIKDALKGVFYRDDSQVISLNTIKTYGLEPGVLIVVEPVTLNHNGWSALAYHPSRIHKGELFHGDPTA